MILEATEKALQVICKITRSPRMINDIAPRVDEAVFQLKAKHLRPAGQLTIWDESGLKVDKVGRDTYVVNSTRDKSQGPVVRTVKGLAGLKQLAKDTSKQRWANNSFQCTDTDIDWPADSLIVAVDDILTGRRYDPRLH